MIQIAVIFLVFFSQYASGDEDVSVKTTKGQVTGKRITVGINDSTGLYHGTADVFLGIPFAESTAPPMRFQLPLERKPWSQTLLATDWPAACPQDPAQISQEFNANSDKKLPVMIWIHGGAFVFGYAKKFPADGIITNLVNRGVVVVTIQYRLGALGFFTTRTHDFEANLGLFDQLMAFRWVQREISNFGGDAGNVTIFGESAGACSVAFHTYSNISVTQNLYHRAIMESGAAKTCLSGYLYRDQQQSHDFALKLCAKYNFTMAQWNSGNFNNLNTCLNTESYASIVDAQKAGAGVWLVVAHPNSTFLPGTPKQLAEAMGKNRPPLPVIIGTNRDEMVADVGRKIYIIL
uniref:Carboxylic ester hydrolase n=1 Tax=Plectus sambesii TaxID=2011161 RepID=A0A914X2P2_9BILA